MKKITFLFYFISVLGYSQTPITNDNFQTAINTCLSTNPVDGMCSDSEYGAMPNWDVSNVTDMSNAFEEKTTFNADISAWNVSSVTNMKRMFYNAGTFNADISAWNVSSVSNMERMFYNADNFNRDIGSWDVSNVTNMTRMFMFASSFNQDLSFWCVTNLASEPESFSAGSSLSESNKPVWGTCPTTPITNDNFQTAINTCLSTNPVDGMCSDSEYGAMPNWDVSNITDMSNAFENRTTFNADIGAWDVSNVTSMGGMFQGASSFNNDLSSWHVVRVTNMEDMFKDADSFDQDISSWCVTNFSSEPTGFSAGSLLSESNKPVWGTCPTTPITNDNFQTAINTCLSTNPVDGMCVYSEYGAMPNWDVSNVTDMSNAFEEKTTFNADISAWNVSSVTNMKRMFYNAGTFNADISAWNVSSVSNMERMFYNADNFNRDIGSWDVSNVTNMTRMFMFASSFNQDLSFWCVTNLASEPESFSAGSSLSESNKPVWGTCPTTPITNDNFQTAINTCLSTNPVDGMCSDSEYGAMPNWDVSNITDMSNAFENRTTFNADIGAWDVSNVTSMGGMFQGASSFNNDLSSWHVVRVTNMEDMFKDADSFDQDISSWCVTNFSSEPTGFSAGSLLSESNKPVWGTCPTTPITNDNFQTAINTCLSTNPVDGMCVYSEYGAMPNWDVSNVTDMSNAFEEKTTFNADISAWNVSSVTNMKRMFYNAGTFNADISAWNVSSVSNMERMFYNADNFNRDIGSWDVSNVTNMTRMFMFASSFNQDLSFWCVTNLASEPESFSAGSSLSESNKPVWGTCPTTPITNDNFQTAINTCLSTNPVDGMCSDSEYGAMPNWDVSNVTDMSNAFEEKTTFNADISAWHVVRVTNMDSMFKGTDSFDQDISSWCVTNFSSEPTGFSAGSLLSESNKPVWGTCPTTPITNDNFQTAINTCLSTNPVDGMCVYSEYGAMPNWDVSNVTDMSNAFEEKTTFNADISAWNVSSVTNMKRMFYNAGTFNADISAWNVSSVSNMERMFYNADNFNRDIGSWDVSNVTNMTRMFMFASSFNQDLSFWCVTNLASEPESFSAGSSLSESNKPVWGTCPNLSIDEQNQLYILIYPNPTSDKLFIKGLSSTSKVSIYNVLGEFVLSNTIADEIDVKHLSKGVYILKIIDKQKETTCKFIRL